MPNAVRTLREEAGRVKDNETGESLLTNTFAFSGHLPLIDPHFARNLRRPRRAVDELLGMPCVGVVENVLTCRLGFFGVPVVHGVRLPAHAIHRAGRPRNL